MTIKDISSTEEPRPKNIKTNLDLAIRPKYTCSNSGGVAPLHNSCTASSFGQKFTTSGSMPAIYQYQFKGSSTTWLDAGRSNSVMEDDTGTNALSECAGEKANHDEGTKDDGQSDASDGIQLG